MIKQARRIAETYSACKDSIILNHRSMYDKLTDHQMTRLKEAEQKWMKKKKEVWGFQKLLEVVLQ